MSCLQESQLARFHQELAVARSFSGKHYDDDDAFEDDDGEAYEDEDEPPATDHREEHLGRMSEIGRATGQCTVVTSAFQYLDSYCLTRCIIIIIQSFPIPLPGSGWKKDSQSTRVHECKVSILRTQSNSPTILSHGLVHMPPASSLISCLHFAEDSRGPLPPNFRWHFVLSPYGCIVKWI